MKQSSLLSLIEQPLFPFYRFVSISKQPPDKMLSATTIRRSNTMLTFILVGVALFLLFDSAQATFKKPPFNGSIFGKRGYSISDYEGAGKTLSSLCEIAVEACSAWLPQMEAKK